MNNELYDYICKADINNSLKSTTYIILKYKDTSHHYLQETFFNILASSSIVTSKPLPTLI